MSEKLGATRGLEISRFSTGNQERPTRVALDFTSGAGPAEAGPFVALTVLQWTALQHLARSITWPAP